MLGGWKCPDQHVCKMLTLKEAENVFINLPNPDTVCWGALLDGYTQYGRALRVLQLFNKMQDTGTKPDRVLFLSALKACSTAGCSEQW